MRHVHKDTSELETVTSARREQELQVEDANCWSGQQAQLLTPHHQNLEKSISQKDRKMAHLAFSTVVAESLVDEEDKGITLMNEFEILVHW